MKTKTNKPAPPVSWNFAKDPCPVIATFANRMYYSGDDAFRRIVLSHTSEVTDTKSTKDVEAKRAWLAIDWIVREHATAWLDIAGMRKEAASLRALPELCCDAVDAAVLTRLYQVEDGAIGESWDEVTSTPDFIETDTSWCAVLDAARDAARVAPTSIQMSEAVASGRRIAKGAARIVATRAAPNMFELTKAMLQRSAVELLDRMIALTDVEGEAP